MGNFPCLINPVEIHIKQILGGGITIPAVNYIDPVFGEPTSKKIYGDAATSVVDDVLILEGQVNYGDASNHFQERQITESGDAELSLGWLVFVKSDLDDAGVVLNSGDKIIKIASQEEPLVIKEVRPESPLDGDFLLIYAEFMKDPNEREAI